MKKYCCLFILLLFFISARSQDIGYKTIDVGGEFQWYPTGYIPTLHLAYGFPLHHSIQLRIGYNKANHEDKGKHDDEQGGGPGFSLGYRYYIPVRPHGLFVGARTDLWHMKIDWKQGTTSGTSKLWVIQPTFEVGYMILINDMFFITPSISNGVEINVNTIGDPVGEGFITLVGLSAGWRF